MKISINDLVEISKKNFFGSTDRVLKVITEIYDKDNFWAKDISIEDVTGKKISSPLTSGSRLNVSEINSIVGKLDGDQLVLNEDYEVFSEEDHISGINDHLNKSFGNQ